MILLFREYHPHFHISKHVPNISEVLENAWGRSEKDFLADQPNSATGTDDYEIKKLFFQREGVSVWPLNTKISIWVLFSTRWLEHSIADLAAVGKIVKLQVPLVSSCCAPGALHSVGFSLHSSPPGADTIDTTL